MHYAVHGHTVAELIVDRADAEKEHNGAHYIGQRLLNGKIIKSDVCIDENYTEGK
jgi:Virulence protein